MTEPAPPIGRGAGFNVFKCTLAHGQIETIRTIQQLADLVCFRLDSGRGRGMGKSVFIAGRL